jgi:hypothetical protein
MRVADPSQIALDEAVRREVLANDVSLPEAIKEAVVQAMFGRTSEGPHYLHSPVVLPVMVTRRAPWDSDMLMKLPNGAFRYL